MKKVYAINGSPRRNKNTATLLDKVLEGVKEAAPEAVTERIDLYGLKYTGCVSCFACKRKDGPSYGRCALRDGLHDVLEKLREADAFQTDGICRYHIRRLAGVDHYKEEREQYI